MNPRKLTIHKPIEDFNKLIFHFTIKVVDINADIAEISATLWATYQSIKGMDAIQIASAINEQGKSFVTNDLRLKKNRGNRNYNN